MKSFFFAFAKFVTVAIHSKVLEFIVLSFVLKKNVWDSHFPLEKFYFCCIRQVKDDGHPFKDVLVSCCLSRLVVFLIIHATSLISLTHLTCNMIQNLDLGGSAAIYMFS